SCLAPDRRSAWERRQTTGLAPRSPGNQDLPMTNAIRAIAFDLTPGQMGDVRSAEGLIDKLPKAAQVLADTAYDSDKFREFLIARGSTPVIKPNPTRKKIPPFDKAAYKGRNVIERAFSHLKDWRRVATRYDKLARNFRATITLALLVRWWI